MFVSFVSGLMLINCLFLEVVLSLLLESFIFAESKQEVRWNLGGISHPVVPKSLTPIKSQMPLIVTAVGAEEA